MLTDKAKGVSEDCIEFLNGRVAVNLVPFESAHFIPRVGERVFLPGTSEGDKTYEVQSVEYIYAKDESAVDDPFDMHAKPLKIVVRVAPVHVERTNNN
jgi:hypothetical protein